jgi:hypothetical protein
MAYISMAYIMMAYILMAYILIPDRITLTGADFGRRGKNMAVRKVVAAFRSPYHLLTSL